MSLTPLEIREQYNKKYDKGVLNHLVRMWFYLKKGLDLINDFKYLLAGIIAFYYALKLDSFWWMILIFVIAIPLLVGVGWFYTHKMSKALEWTAMVFSSYFARYNVDMAEKNIEYTEKNMKSLEKIRDLLELITIEKKI
jgi:hypothetical protein